MDEKKKCIIKVVKDGKSLSWGMNLTENEKRILQLALTQLCRYNYLYNATVKEGIYYADK